MVEFDGLDPELFVNETRDQKEIERIKDEIENGPEQSMIEKKGETKENVCEAGNQKEVERLEDRDEMRNIQMELKKMFEEYWNGAEKNVSDSGHQQGQPLTPLPFGLPQALVPKVLPNSDLLNPAVCYLDDYTLLKGQQDLQAAIKSLAQLSIMLRQDIV